MISEKCGNNYRIQDIGELGIQKASIKAENCFFPQKSVLHNVR